MKILLLGLLLSLSILHASAQDIAAQDDLLKKREATVKKLRELMANPATTPEMKLKLVAAAFDLLDQDTAMLQADRDLLDSAKKALDAKIAVPTPPTPTPTPAPDASKPHGVHPPDARTAPLPAN